VHEEFLREEARRVGVQHLLEILPPIPYREALGEMLCADALLLMQGSISNHQIPAKLYEYLRAQRPILCLADLAGNTASAVRSVGIDAIAPLDDAAAIALLLCRFARPAASPLITTPNQSQVREASRLGRTQRLATWLDEILAKSTSHP
jgi:hypothetical protein